MNERAHDRNAVVPETAAPSREDARRERSREAAQQVGSPAGRNRPLLDAMLAVGSELDLDVVLNRIVRSAVALVDARYGALGVLGEDGAISEFLTVGVDEETAARIGHPPRGEGILGLLVDRPEPLRLTDLTRHHASVGFPAGHPPMTTFLGVPIQVRGKVFGNLYLAEKQGGGRFDADDEAVLRTLAAAAGVAIDNARLYEEAHRRQRWLAASDELTRSLLSGREPHQVLDSLAATVRDMSGADLAVLAVPVGDTGELVVETAAGARAADLQGQVLSPTSPAAQAFATGATVGTGMVDVPDRRDGGLGPALGLGPAFAVPLRTRERMRGALLVANAPGGTAFPQVVVDMITAFGDQAALTLDVAEQRRDAERIMVLTDRDRIARDLHDLVIQRLFAGALSLQSALGRVTDRPKASERIQRVVADLDDTIKVIRSTIYGLRESDRETGTTLRSRLVGVTDRASEVLGFTPALRMTGLLDTAVPAEHGAHLLAVLEEALSNAARHARASAVDVSVDVAGAVLRLRVADNGRGIGPRVTRRSGLANLRERAEALGGTLELSAEEGAGTLVRWTVPLPPSVAAG
ncbi:sensor histidine kinase [Streptomyces tendae]|uniref:sensor histidine kinase n=1 Tax=Streptomyces tendae TaxID=1932 RepID=UPI0037183CA2